MNFINHKKHTEKNKETCQECAMQLVELRAEVENMQIDEALEMRYHAEHGKHL